MSLTIKDIARMAGVSTATVSRVINNNNSGFSEDTKEKILKIMEENDYRPSSLARSLVTKRSNIIGVLLPDISNPFFPDLVKGIEDTANIMGYNIILCNSNDDVKKEEEYLKILREKYVDGIIYTTVISTEEEGLKRIIDYKIPCVLLDRSINHNNIPLVYVDSEISMYNITKYLIEKGHSKIAYISGPLYSASPNLRLVGYKKALKEANIKIDNALIKEGNYKFDGGKECMLALIKEGLNFTAVACGNDVMALGAIEALKENNIKVPEDISITGFDNIFTSSLITPALTTVSLPIYNMGCTAAKQLINLIEGKRIKKKVLLNTEIIERGSVRNI